MDDNLEAEQRTSVVLEAHRRMSNGEHHPLDAPGASIERLLTDLMHYAHRRNEGKTVASVLLLK